MLSSTVLDVAIGLIFTFLAFSLAVSSIVEALASLIKLRSATLLEGVKDLLNDQNFTGLALKLYNHALINPRESGDDAGNRPRTAGWKARISLVKIWIENHTHKRPAYIDSKQFAAAMVDVLKLTGGDPAAMKAVIDSNPLISGDEQLQTMLNGMVERTAGDLSKIQQQLAGWFDNAMDRVSGAYKRRTQWWGFIIALVMAILLNVNAIKIGQTLWGRPLVSRAIAAKVDLSDAKAGEAIANLDVLEAQDVPIGWTTQDFDQLFAAGRVNTGFAFGLIAGWLIIALATLFGAPFWFDSLQQIVRLKGSGPSPAEKADKTAAAG